MAVKLNHQGVRINLSSYAVVLSKAQFGFLKAQAKKHGINRSEMFRIWIDRAIESGYTTP